MINIFMFVSQQVVFFCLFCPFDSKLNCIKHYKVIYSILISLWVEFNENCGEP